MEKAQALSEISLVEMCYRMTQVQKAITVSKEFSIKFNGHMKLLTSLVNTLYEEEEEESLFLFEQKIEKRVDHIHERIIFKKTRTGEEKVYFEGDEDESTMSKRNATAEFGRITNNPSVAHNLGAGVFGTQENLYRQGVYGRGGGEMGRIGTRSVQNYDKEEDDRIHFENMRGDPEVQSAHNNHFMKKGYRDEMDFLRKNEQGKKGALYIDPNMNTEESNYHMGKTSEDLAVSKRLDLIMKESELFKEIIKNGEQNATYLKDCMLKLIDAFKNNNNSNQSNSNTNKHEKIERYEKIIEGGSNGNVGGERHKLDINILHKYPGGTTTLNDIGGDRNWDRENINLKNEIDNLKRENERLKRELLNVPLGADDLREKLKKVQDELNDMEDENNKMRKDIKKIKREKTDLEEDNEHLNKKFRDMKSRSKNNRDDNDLRDEIDRLKEKLRKEEENNKRLERDLDDLKRKEEKLISEKNELVEKNINSVIELKKNGEYEKDGLYKKLREKEDEVQQLSDDLKGRNKYLLKLESEIFELNNENKELKNNLQEIMDGWEEEEKNLTNNHNNIKNALKEENDELKKKLEKVETLFQDNKGNDAKARNFYKQKSENLEKQNNRLNKQIEDLEKKNRRNKNKTRRKYQK